MGRDQNDARIGLLRLKSGQSPGDVEAELRARAPHLVGSLLTWLHDDWYALAPDARNEVKPGRPGARAALDATGAAEYTEVEVLPYIEILGMRNPQAGASTTARRDRDLAAGIFVEEPRFWQEVDYRGGRIKMDWQNIAADLPAAWAQLGEKGPGAYANIRVGHIDTGYTEHPVLGWTTADGTWLLPALGKNYWKERLETPGVGEEPMRWLNEAPEFDGPRDNLTGPFGGHGTRTLSLLAGLYAPADEDLAYPFFGAAPGAPVVPFRITDAVVIDHVSDLLAKAIRAAVAQSAQVISISLGAVRADRKVARAINEAYERGVIICAAAGNVIPWVIYPGRFSRVITVGGATTADGEILHPWRGASRGSDVDISGPADVIRRGTTVLENGLQRFVITNKGDGTSFATAMCAGIAALWLAKRGTELEQAYGSERWARVAAFKLLLQSTARKIPGWDTANYGPGVYQAGELLRAELPALADLTPEAPASA